MCRKASQEVTDDDENDDENDDVVRVYGEGVCRGEERVYGEERSGEGVCRGCMERVYVEERRGCM